MKRFVFGVFIACLLSTPLWAQQVQTQKIPIIAKQLDIFQTASVSALNTQTGQTLVVWERVSGTDHSLLGRLINSKGKPASGLISLAPHPASRPAVTYNANKNEFLISYDDNPDLRQVHTDVYVRKLGPTGRPVAAATKVTGDAVSTAMANFLSKVTVNPRNGNYGIVWLREVLTQDQLAQKNNGLVGTVLTGTGNVPGAIGVITPTVFDNALSNPYLWPIPLDILYHPTNGKVVVGFVQVVPGSGANQANYTLGTLEGNFANIVPANLAKVNPKVLTLSAQFSWGIKLAFFTNGTGMIYFVDTANMKRRKLNNLGKLAGAAAVAFKPPKNNSKLFFPSLAFVNGPSGIRGLLLAVEGAFNATGAAVLWGQFLTEVGLPLGAPVRIDTTIATETALATTLVGIPQPATSATYRFAAFYIQAAFIPPGQDFQSSGILELNLNATLP